MTIPQVFTKIKKKVESNVHLDDKSKLIMLHIMRQVFKEIPREDLVEYDDNTPIGGYKDSQESLDAFNRIFGDIFKEGK